MFYFSVDSSQCHFSLCFACISSSWKCFFNFLTLVLMVDNSPMILLAYVIFFLDIFCLSWDTYSSKTFTPFTFSSFRLTTSFSNEFNSFCFLQSLSYNVYACSTKSFLYKHIKSIVQIRVIFNQGSPGWENLTPQVLCIIGMQHWYPFTPLYCIQFIHSHLIHWCAEVHVVITRLLSLLRSFDYGSKMRKITLSMTIFTQSYCPVIVVKVQPYS